MDRRTGGGLYALVGGKQVNSLLYLGCTVRGGGSSNGAEGLQASEQPFVLGLYSSWGWK